MPGSRCCLVGTRAVRDALGGRPPRASRLSAARALSGARTASSVQARRREAACLRSRRRGAAGSTMLAQPAPCVMRHAMLRYVGTVQPYKPARHPLIHALVFVIARVHPCATRHPNARASHTWRCAAAVRLRVCSLRLALFSRPPPAFSCTNVARSSATSARRAEANCSDAACRAAAASTESARARSRRCRLLAPAGARCTHCGGVLSAGGGAIAVLRFRVVAKLAGVPGAAALLYRHGRPC